MKMGDLRASLTTSAVAGAATLLVLVQPAAATVFSGCVLKGTPPLVVAANNGDKHSASEILQLARAGNAMAEYRVGKLYLNGWSFPRNYTKGIEWELKVAMSPDKCAAGPAAGLLNYEASNGVSLSRSAAAVKRGNALIAQALRRAASKGNAAAETYLGDAYRHAQLGLNLGRRKNCLTAVGLMYEAAKQGYAPAENSLGDAYTGAWGRRGVCVPFNAYWGRKGLRLLTQAARQGDVQAEMSLATDYRIGGPGIHTNPAPAFYWHKKAAAVLGKYGEQ